MIQDKHKSKYVVMLLLVMLSVIVTMIFGNVNNNEGKVIINGINIQKMNGKNKMGVYIDGEVKNPGFIHIQKGQSLEYALNKIGGITDNADIHNIDLNMILKDGEKIVIPSKQKDFEADNIENYVQSERVVNINSASKEELKTLEGIGEKTAEKIIEYRKNKNFEDVDEIIKVKGIGAAKYEKIKDNICV